MRWTEKGSKNIPERVLVRVTETPKNSITHPSALVFLSFVFISSVMVRWFYFLFVFIYLFIYRLLQFSKLDSLVKYADLISKGTT